MSNEQPTIEPFSKDDPYVLHRSVLRLVVNSVKTLGHYMNPPPDSGVELANPWLTYKHPFEFDFQRYSIVSPRPRKRAVSKRSEKFWRYHELYAFYILTKGLGVVISPEGERRGAVLGLPQGSVDRLTPRQWDELADCYTFGLREGQKIVEDDDGPWPVADLTFPAPPADEHIEIRTIDNRFLEEKLGDLRRDLIHRLSFNKPVPGCIVVQFLPFVLDEGRREAYYQVWVGLVFSQNERIDSDRRPELSRKFWIDQLEALEEDPVISHLQAAGDIWAAAAEKVAHFRKEMKTLEELSLATLGRKVPLTDSSNLSRLLGIDLPAGSRLPNRLLEEKRAAFNPRKKEPLVHFPSPEGLKWVEVTITFMSDHSLKIEARGSSETYTFAELGFKDHRKGDLPDSRWDMLIELAVKRQISWHVLNTPKTRARAKAAIKDIRKRLKIVMGLEEDPFEPYRSAKAYRSKFRIVDNRY